MSKKKYIQHEPKSSNEPKNSSNEPKNSSNEQKNSLNEQNILYYFSVRLGQLNGRALRLGQARGRALRPGQTFKFNNFQQN